MDNVLLLNANYTPAEVISWERAITLLLEDKVYVVVNYAKQIRSATQSWDWPAVVALKEFFDRTKQIRFSRSNVLARDVYECQYCGVRPRTPQGKPDINELTIDHVIPRAQSKNGRVTLPWNGESVPVTSWRNIATACCSCNSRKADRTPDQAKMKLKRIPFVPSMMDSVWMAISKHHIPNEWKDFLPESSPWRDYWDVELDPT